MDRDCRGIGHQPQGCTKYGPQLNGQGLPQDLRRGKQPPIGSRFTHLATPQECALPMLALPLPPHKEGEPLLPRAGEGLLPEHLLALRGETGLPPGDPGNAAEASPALTPWMMSLVIRPQDGDKISPI